MPQRLFLLPLFALVVMFAVPVGGAMGADYQTGLDAYKNEIMQLHCGSGNPLLNRVMPVSSTIWGICSILDKVFHRTIRLRLSGGNLLPNRVMTMQ